MKRSISILLSVFMVLSIFASLAVADVVAVEEIEITNTNPCITADVGEKINLSAYSVVFDGDTVATGSLTWKNGDTAVTSFTPSAKGVTPLTATNGKKTKTVYVVAKNPSETEYVLYEADFSKFSSLQELKDAGWKFLNPDSYYSVSGGTLNLGTTGHDYIRAILPAWLGDFGDYSITSEVKMTATMNDSRWFGLVYRIQNENGSYYPYYHMCIRENTKAQSGVEFAERTAANGWNVALTGPGQVKMSDGYHVAKVEAYGTNVRYTIDDEQILYVTKNVIGVKTGTYNKGYLGITMNYGTTALKNIKVCVQSEKPAASVVATKLTNNEHQDISLRNPIAIVEKVDSVNGIKNSVGNIYYEVNNKSVTDVLKKAIDEKCLPNFYCATKADVDKVLTAMTATPTDDVCIISDDTAVLDYVRLKKSTVRAGLQINLTKNTLASKEANDIRTKVRKAPATFCVISGENVSRQIVMELQALAVAVWVKVDAPAGSEAYAAEAAKAISVGANGVICDSAKSLANFINENYSKSAMTRTPIIIGHRGNPTQAPENSLASFIKAYENGADVFEVDVEITKDNEIIIMHDNTINRTSNYTGSATINQMTLAEIKQYYLKDDQNRLTEEKIPTLKEVFEYFKDKDIRIFIEFKGSNYSNVPATCNLIKQYGMEDRVDVISFSTTFISQTQQYLPGMSTGYLCSGGGGISTVEDSLNTFYTYWVTASMAKSSVNPNQTGVEFIQVGTDRGITIWPWTFTIWSNNAAFLSGCDGVTTNDCQWFKDMYQYINVNKTSEDLAVGDKSKVAVYGETYGRAKNNIDVSKTNVIVLSGKECINVNKGVISGKKDGKAVVMYEYVTKTYGGTEYTLYSEPVTIYVGDRSATLVGGQDANAEFDIALSGSANYAGAGSVIDVVVSAKNIKHENGLATFECIFNYDASKVKLVSATSSDNSIDCMTKVPDSDWENMSCLKSEGTVLLAAVTTAGNAFIKNQGDIEFTLKFEVLPDVDNDILFYVATNTVKATDWDKPKAVITGNGDYIKVSFGTGMLGDINGDGRITARDYGLLKRYCLGTYEFNDAEKAVADINGDGKITSRDYGLLKRHCLGTYDIFA